MSPDIRGTKAFKAMVGAYLKALPDFHQPLTGQWAIGDTLITEGTTEGTLKGALGPIRPTGKPISVHFLDLVQFKDGKFVRGVTYSNSVELLTQAGVIKPPKK
jgi:ketosteroid isomerase-like protein